MGLARPYKDIKGANVCDSLKYIDNLSGKQIIICELCNKTVNMDYSTYKQKVKSSH